MPATANEAKLRVGFLTVPNYSMIAFTNAVEPLRMANRLSGLTLCSWTILSVSGAPVQASNGLSVAQTVKADPDRTPPFDILFVCGGVDIHAACDNATLGYLRRVGRHGGGLGALCTGSYVLARASLLDGYRCAIHWENIAAVREAFPRVNFTSEVFVIDRNRYTASGGTAPLDLMLNLIDRAVAKDLSIAISEEFTLERIRDARDQQRIPLLARVGARQQKIIEAASRMEAHIEDPIELDDVAEQVGLSRRQLERLFKRHLAIGPARYYLELRLARARQLLLQTNMSITDITVSCGFPSAPHFSKCYRDLYGHPPSAERRLANRPAVGRAAG